MIGMSVRGDRGNVVARAECGLEWFQTLADLDPVEFPMLAGLDPYADAVFNSRQVPVLLAELDRLPAERGGPWVDAVRDLCRVAGQRVHRYVWFVGD
jgi:hypothetical protein